MVSIGMNSSLLINLRDPLTQMQHTKLSNKNLNCLQTINLAINNLQLIVK